MTIPMFHVDAFTDRPFAGNPAAVCILSSARDASWMQAVATDMNLSETAFLLREGSGFRLRWFIPKVEVDLCGHATLASAGDWIGPLLSGSLLAATVEQEHVRGTPGIRTGWRGACPRVGSARNSRRARGHGCAG